MTPERVAALIAAAGTTIEAEVGAMCVAKPRKR